MCTDILGESSWMPIMLSMFELQDLFLSLRWDLIYSNSLSKTFFTNIICRRMFEQLKQLKFSRHNLSFELLVLTLTTLKQQILKQITA